MSPFGKSAKDKEKPAFGREGSKKEEAYDAKQMRGGKMPMKGMGKKMKRGKC